MRLAVLIVGIALSLAMGIQALIVYGFSSVGNNTTLAGAGAVALLVAFMMFVASALTMGLPRTASVLFLIAGLLALLMAAASDYRDLLFWGVVSLVLAVFAFIGWRGKRRAELRAPVERKDDIDRAVAAGIAAATSGRSGECQGSTIP